jgi:hypothetical protein
MRGLAVDESGQPAYDPSANVLDLVRAAVTRLDDLQESREKLAELRQEALRREMDLRAEHQKAFAILRGEHSAENLRSEARRIDALRELDRLEVRTATERHQVAVEALARTTATLADTLRTSAENMARSLAAQAEASKKETDARIEASKKEADARISAIERSLAAGTGKGEGSKSNLATISTILSIILMLIALGTFVFVTQRAAPPVAPAPAAVAPR